MLKVLIVDDDKHLCECLLKLIDWNQLGCIMPECSYNGAIAWEQIQEKEYDLLICDLKMPGISGVELCQLVKEKYKEIEIIFLSAYEDFQVAKYAMKFKVLDYILKPINRTSLDNLEALIFEVVSKKREKQWFTDFFKGLYKEKLSRAINEGDTEYVNAFFESIPSDNHEKLINVCISLLRILYDNLVLLNENEKTYLSQYEKWCKTIYSMQDAKACVEYVRSKYKEYNSDKIQQSDNMFLIKNIKKMVNEHYLDCDCNISWIADQLSMSSGYVGRIFVKHTEIPLQEYIQEKRLKCARKLLIESAYSIAEIAQMSGYSNSNYFSTSFKKKYKLSPTEYRDTKRGER